MISAGAEMPEAGLEAHLTRHGSTWVLAICVAAFLLTYLAPVDATFSDPALTLLTAQAIVEHGTVRLDGYVADPRWDFGPLLPEENGHFYDYFPLGTSLLAAPAVWLALPGPWAFPSPPWVVGWTGSRSLCGLSWSTVKAGPSR